MDSNALNITECKGFPGLHVFEGLDNLKEMQSPKSDINFTFGWLSSDALPADVKNVYIPRFLVLWLRSSHMSNNQGMLSYSMSLY